MTLDGTTGPSIVEPSSTNGSTMASTTATKEQAATTNSSTENASRIGSLMGEKEREQFREGRVVKLEELQSDPNSPLFSVKSFEDLNLPEALLKGVYAMKFQRPSKIQERTLPILLRDPPQNMIAQSQSGTGKTAAFALCMLARLDPALQATQAICIAPSRELARQNMDAVQSIGKFTSATYSYAIPGAYERDAKINSQVIVGTPGTIADLIRRGMIVTKNVRVFVLDEADNMLDQQGMGDMSMRIRKAMSRTTQTLLFSATFPEHVAGFARRFAPRAYEIMLKQEELSVEGIKQFFVDCPTTEERYEALMNIYGLLTIGQSIIFCQRRDTADEISRRMQADGHNVSSLHGQLEGEQRDRVLEDFRDGKSKILLTTNVIARGIDISQVNMVVNYDLPQNRLGKIDFETYLHRIGRTGRFGRVGASVNFVHDDTTRQFIGQIEEHFGRKMIRVPTDDLELLEKTLLEELKP